MAKFKCLECGKEFKSDDTSRKCPDCGSKYLELMSGEIKRGKSWSSKIYAAR